MAPKGKGTQSAEVETIEAEAQSLRPAQRAFLAMLRDLGQMATEDTGGMEFAGDDLFDILTAETEQEMMEGDEKPQLNAKVLSGCELNISGFEVKFSNSAPASAPEQEINTILIDPATGKKMYLLVHAARLNRAGNEQLYRLPDVGEEMVWNTSARYIVAKLYWYGTHSPNGGPGSYFANGGMVKVRIEGTKLDGNKSVEKLKLLTQPPVSVGSVTRQSEEPPF